jgi:hypothetical protein
MANNIAFQPMGKTYMLSANTAVQSVTVVADSPVNQYLFVNHEKESAGVPVYVRLSASSGNNVAIANATTAQYGVPIPPASQVVLTGPQCSGTSNCFITFIAPSGTPAVYVTPGEGL